jgi:predicted AlkP superfamily pyrophosphatase or phosphodiesterase
MSHAVFMILDGVRPDALQQAATPNLEKLLAKSSYTMTAQSVMPCVTITSHTSMFYSASPEKHGVSGVGQVTKVEHNGLIEQLKAANKKSVAFINWDPLRTISRPLTISASFMANIVSGYVDGEFVGDKFILEHASRELHKAIYDFAFVYWGTTDECGHKFGWMSDEYIRQIEIVDGYIGELLTALPEDTTILVQSDHGGHDYGHGLDIPEDMTIPWFITGPNIKQNYEIQMPVTLLNTAPTLARVLEIEPSSHWEGQCIEEIFE